MVDAVVSVVAQRLGDLLIEQAFLLLEVREEVVWLKNKLEWMQCFLKDAELKQDADYRIHKWIFDIRDVAYDAEDVIDDFVLKVEGITKGSGFRASFKKFFSIHNREAYVYKQAKLYGIRKNIQTLKDRLDEIQRNQELFKIMNIGGDAGEQSSHSNERLKQLRRESPYEDNEHVVGLEEDAKLLTSMLLEGVPHRFVISIVGMGGLGKTTLARKLYNSRSIQDKFECYAWVSVSREYNIQFLLQKLVKSFKAPTTKEQWKMLNDEETLEEYLRIYLDGRSYMVVIDDVWDTKAWQILRRAFPDNKNGSRVIITTRDNTVAELSDERTYVHKLLFLKDEESWELFCKKAFPNYDNISSGDGANRCPPNLEAMARDMVSKCRGLPLAIAVLGALLSRKHSDEWIQVQEHLWSYVKDGSVHVSLILTLSFNNLPHQLKSCFLYLGLFPEDFEINVEKLLRLWIAEGFVQLRGDALEELAAKYFNELIDRNLVQISQRTWKRNVTCRVHDLLRDLAIEKSKELNFLDIHDGRVGSALFPNCRRLGSHCSLARLVSSNYSNLNLPLRTLLSIDLGKEDADPELLESVYTKLRLLRVVLVHSKFRCNSVPKGRRNRRSLLDQVGELIHLRYFELEGINLGQPPRSMGNLGALQTLDFGRFRDPIKLPDEVCNAKKLRHLIGYFRWPFPVKNLSNLRTLKEVYVEDRMDFDPVDLVNLSKLYVRVNDGMNFTLDSVGGLENLRTLLLLWVGKPTCFPALQPLSRCRHLLQLKIWGGNIEKFPPEIHEYLPNLKFLFLFEGNIVKDPMPILEKFQNLTILNFVALRWTKKKLRCNSGGFTRLEILQFFDCSNLEELHVDEGGMAMLRGLEVDPHVRIPERLRSIPNPPKNCDFRDKDDWPY